MIMRALVGTFLTLVIGFASRPIFILTLMVVLALLQGCAPRCAWTTTNHSGVQECHVGPYTGWLPVDTTSGGDVVLEPAPDTLP